MEIEIINKATTSTLKFNDVKVFEDTVKAIENMLNNNYFSTINYISGQNRTIFTSIFIKESLITIKK